MLSESGTLFANTIRLRRRYYGFIVGPAVVLIVWLIQKWKPNWNSEIYCNPSLFFYGACRFPNSPMTNFFPGFLVSLTL